MLDAKISLYTPRHLNRALKSNNLITKNTSVTKWHVFLLLFTIVNTQKCLIKPHHLWQHMKSNFLKQTLHFHLLVYCKFLIPWSIIFFNTYNFDKKGTSNIHHFVNNSYQNRRKVSKCQILPFTVIVQNRTTVTNRQDVKVRAAWHSPYIRRWLTLWAGRLNSPPIVYWQVLL